MKSSMKRTIYDMYIFFFGDQKGVITMICIFMLPKMKCYINIY